MLHGPQPVALAWSRGSVRDRIERGACPEPGKLPLAVGMLQLEDLLGAVRVYQAAFYRLAGRQLPQSEEAQPIVRADPVVVIRMGEGQGEKALLLEVRFVNAGETARDHRCAAQESRREGRVLPAAALAVVGIAHDHPPKPSRAVVAGHCGDRLAGGSS